MGIRFHCPNGHAMNVKAFLAGRRGLCPNCGAKVDIPLQSEPEAITASSAAGDAATDESTDTIVLDLPNLAAPPTLPVEPWSTSLEPAGAGHQAAIGSAVPAPATAPTPPSADSAPHSKELPAAPSLTKWYVRIGTGEQFGPVRDEIMRQWFGEGRIMATTPIWREGWTDWQPASSEFRAKGTLAATPPPHPPKQLSSTNVSALDFDPPVSAVKVSKRQAWTQKQWTTVLSLTMLGLIVVLGTIILVMLLSQVQQPEPQPPPQPPATKTPLSDSSQIATVLA